MNRLIIFARFPVPGQAKTRLIPALGPEGAARLHRRMTEHAVWVARAASRNSDIGVTVCFTGARRRAFRAWLGFGLHYAPQTAGDLGLRLRDAFRDAFRNQAAGAIAIGADIPDVSAELLSRAFDGLKEHDVVLGPAADGGYYLIGMKGDRPELFRGIDWGTERVCAQTRTAIARLGLSALELPTIEDVDRPEDLTRLRCAPRFADFWNDKPPLSVIVPTLDEAGSLGRTLERVRREEDVDLIVADGGSQDATCEIAAQYGAKVMVVPGGRAAQLNAAADLAMGGHLLFLHADTLLPDGYVALVRSALDRPDTVAGAFRFRTDGGSAAMRLVEFGANIRSAVFRWPYGDQGLFMEKRLFRELGGFASLSIMEDVEIVGRLRRRGLVVTLDEAAITSARRWERLGVLRTTLRNQWMIACFRAGVAPERLAQFYRGRRRAKV